MNLTCSVCGTAGDDADPAVALGWSSDTDARGRVTWMCPACTREHVRAIEAKLDRDWW